jgi:hypothetical protein
MAASRLARSSRAPDSSAVSRWASAQRQVVGERGVQVPPEAGECGHLGGESGDYAARGFIARGDLPEIGAGMRLRVGHGRHLRFYGLLSQLTRPDRKNRGFPARRLSRRAGIRR